MTHRTLRYLASHPGEFAALESAHDDRLLNERLDEPGEDEREFVPVQEFVVGERVQSHRFVGTVTAYLPQVHTDNLYRILWDAAPEDSDLYPAHGLSRIVGERAA